MLDILSKFINISLISYSKPHFTENFIIDIKAN